MAFSDYVKDGFSDVHLAGGFEHSSEVLPALAADASEDDKAARAAKALAIAHDVGAQFDAEYAPPNDEVTQLFTEMQAYWSAPVPFGTLPTPPPAELYEKQQRALEQCVAICRAYTADARKLAEAGVPKLKEYIDKFAADCGGALEKVRGLVLQARAMAPAGGTPTGPGPMGLDPFGQYQPMGPMAGAGPFLPMPFGGPGPFTPPMFGGPFAGPFAPPFAPSMPMGGMPGPMAPFPAIGGGMTPEQLKIMTDTQRDITNMQLDMNRRTTESYDRTNKMWSDYLKS